MAKTDGPSPAETVNRAVVVASSGSVSARAGMPWVSRAASVVQRRSMDLRFSRAVPMSASAADSRSRAKNIACACGAVAIPAWWSP
ncbi:Uncharacterised protein [Mycobacteroides abscessus subsp. abscessus]|nr:Uncharacterised protein [Mycobacteroides abscessus subsp. abscessus]